MTGPCVPSNTDLPHTWREDLFSLLDQQRAICTELHRLSDRQAELIRSETASALLELLNQRQILIDTLTEIGHNLEPYRTRWPDLWPQLDIGNQARFEAAVRAVESTIGLIRVHDRQAQSRIEDVKSSIQSDLHTMNAGRASARAYAKSTTGISDRWTHRLADGEGLEG